MEENSALTVFDELGQELRQRWEWLSKQEKDILWSLTDEQSEQLGDLFDDGYRLALEEMNLSTSFDATLKRLAVTIKRIGAILTVLRLEIPKSEENPTSCTFTFNTKAANSSEKSLPEVLYCSDEDFKTLVMLSEKLMRHAALMMLMLPDETESALPAQIGRPKQSNLLKELLPEKFTTQDAIKVGVNNGLSERSVMRWISEAIKDKQVVKTAKGHYQLVK